MNDRFDKLWEWVKSSGQLSAAEARRLSNRANHRGRHPLSLWLDPNGNSLSSNDDDKDRDSAFFEADTLAGELTLSDLREMEDARPGCPPELADWDRYQIDGYLGAGGMGRVYRARDPRLNRSVAVKFLRKDDEGPVRRFMQEARTQARIEHDNVCRIYEVGEVKGRHYIAMQYIDGEPLQNAARQMTLEQKVVVIRDVARGLHQAHRLGLIHRDIKPSNILVAPTEDGWHPYLVDFGLARESVDHGLTVTGALLGTPYYMAPEQARGDTHLLDRRTDVYGLGATLYEILADRPPFQGKTFADIIMKVLQDVPDEPGNHRMNIPVDVAAIVMRCLRKAPPQRYDSAKAMADDLDRYLDGEPVTARPTTFVHRLRMKAAKHKLAVTVGSVFSLLLFAALGWGIYQRWLSSEKAKLARQFGTSVSAMDGLNRFAMMSPPHDVRPELAQIGQRMEEIRARKDMVGPLAQGPGDYALGVGYLLLEDIESARDALLLAWDGGYREPVVAYSLGLAYGRLYDSARQRVMLNPDAVEREKTLATLRVRYRQPAIDFLSRVNDSDLVSPDYVAALLAFYDERLPEALAKAKLASASRSWFYEAVILEGRIKTENMLKSAVAGDFDEAMEHSAEAEQAFRRALDVGRSDPEVYTALGNLFFDSFWIITNGTGGDPNDFFERGIAICDQGLNVHPEWSPLVQIRSSLYRRKALWRKENGEEPGLMLQLAVRDATAALALDPDSADAMMSLGDACRSFGEHLEDTGEDPRDHFKMAVDAYERAEALRPTTSLFNRIGLLYRSMGRYETAHGGAPITYFERSEAAYRRGLALEEDLQLHNNLGVLLLNKARFELGQGRDAGASLSASVEAFEAGLKISPGQYRALYNLGRAYRMLGQIQLDSEQDPQAFVDKAVAAYTLAVDHAPSAASLATMQDAIGLTHVLVASYQIIQGEDPRVRLGQAIENFDQAIQANPSYLFAYTNKVYTLGLKGDYLSQIKAPALPTLIEALAILEDVLDRNAAFINARYSQLWIYSLTLIEARLTKQEFEPLANSAVDAIRAGLDQSPKDLYIFQVASDIAIERGLWALEQNLDSLAAFEEGKRYLDRAIALNPGDKDLRISLGDLYWAWSKTSNDEVAMQRVEAGLAIADEILAEFPEDAGALLLRGRMLWRRCDWEGESNVDGDECRDPAIKLMQRAVEINSGLKREVRDIMR